MPRLHNQSYFKIIRKHLRNNSTSAEASLWKILKNSQIGGYKFRRQHSVGKYVLDFYCSKLKLGIELDGEPHADIQGIAKDSARDEWLLEQGIYILRYENRWVFEYPDVVIQDIIDFAERKK